MPQLTRAQWIDGFTMALGRFAVECEPESLALMAALRYPTMSNLDPEVAAAAEYFEWSPHDDQRSRGRPVLAEPRGSLPGDLRIAPV